MKKFCKSLREHAMKIINFRKKKIKLLTKEQQALYENAKIFYICRHQVKVCYIYKEKFENIYVKDQKDN